MLKTSNTQSGFTLVELAIVLMIIGLLIGGVLRGQELMNNAKISATIQQVKAYQGATVTFMDGYSSYPGDLPTATSRVPGCTAANFCVNGDGNGILGVANGTTIMQVGNAATRVETSMFWKHLAMAHLISGVSPSANPATPEWGETHPASKLRGGFHALNLAGNLSTRTVQTGLFLRLQTAMSGSSMFSGSGCSSSPCPSTEAVSAREAWLIDTKMDDGLPEGGNVYSDDQGGGAASCEWAYDPRVEGAACVMYFKV